VNVLNPDTVVKPLPVTDAVEAVAIFSAMVLGTLVEPDAFVLAVEVLVADVVVVPTIFHRMGEINCEKRTTYIVFRRGRY
jgi:hypothetical protein